MMSGSWEKLRRSPPAVCASRSSVAVSPTTHAGIQPRNTRNTRKVQGVVVVNVWGSGVSHPFREAVGCLASVFLFRVFRDFRGSTPRIWTRCP